MEVYMMIDGKKIEFSEETARNIQEQFMPKKKSIFDRVDNEHDYYYVDYQGNVDYMMEDYDSIDEKNYNVVNYCTDKEYLQNRTDREILNRKLEKFSLENGGDEIDWEDRNQYKYNFIIVLDNGTSKICLQSRRCLRNIGVTYFISKQVCQQAIDKFGDEIKRVYGLE